MGKRADWRLDASLTAYATTVRASARVNALKRSAEKWPVYAAVTGAAMAMATNASASIIYSGVINAATATSTGHGGAGGSHHRSARGNTRTNIALGNATGDKLGVRIAVMRSQSLYGIYFRGNIELSGKGMNFLASGGPEGFDHVKVIDWAYDNTGASILAGQEAATSPEPSTMALMLLAAGGAGVGALRRRRKAQTR